MPLQVVIKPKASLASPQLHSIWSFHTFTTGRLCHTWPFLGSLKGKWIYIYIYIYITCNCGPQLPLTAFYSCTSWLWVTLLPAAVQISLHRSSLFLHHTLFISDFQDVSRKYIYMTKQRVVLLHFLFLNIVLISK